MDNVAITKAIFGPENDPGGGRDEGNQVLLDHLADGVVFEAIIPEGRPISGACRRKHATACSAYATVVTFRDGSIARIVIIQDVSVLADSCRA